MDTLLNFRIASLEEPREVIADSELIEFAEQITLFFADLSE